MRRITFALVLVSLFILLAGIHHPTLARQNTDEVVLAYVHENTVKLADAQGNPITIVGPEFQTGQAANLLWTPDGERLYIARRDGLYETSAEGGAAVRLPGDFSITMTLDRGGKSIYYIESSNPADADEPGFITFPLRETSLLNMGGTGRLVNYIGNYSLGSSDVALGGAAFQYARDGGILGGGRPRLIPTYGTTLFYSCCFPDAGLNAIDIASGEIRAYDSTFIPGPSAINSSLSRLAGPTINGTIRVIDLITAGTRDYPINFGDVERIAWALDDSALYLAVRGTPKDPLPLSPLVTSPIDDREADIFVWRLDLVTGGLVQLAELGDFYGVSSIAATDEYVFLTVVERNVALINDLNSGRLPADLSPADPRLTSDYLTGSILFRVRTDGSEALSILADVWGVVAKPRH
ncbi:MAG: hypothetical protein BroJett018_03000 [Chloroflexota bacterium]|nr:hypothetical protein [Chloroflexota bacterium]NOG61905.1 hypothetical protein [Chloroflexota bacterium]GIK62506.1 MAG: hypothetical protein BroJett018_03000 [Chloroflexota bacterium]